MLNDFKPCAIIPVFDHHRVLPKTVAQLRAHNLDVILIDDGSAAICLAVQEELAQADDRIHLFKRSHNGGKGAAVKDGLILAQQQGFSHALQIDADGQHNTDDIPDFLERAKNQPQTLIAGMPAYDDSVPKLRLYARYLTHVWVWINTLSLDIKDSMCGFRVYPLAQSVELISHEPGGNRMDFDPEFMVRWHWRDWPLEQISTAVSYPLDGISHFQPRLDNWLITMMHTRLFFGMLRRLPQRLLTKLQQCKCCCRGR